MCYNYLLFNVRPEFRPGDELNEQTTLPLPSLEGMIESLRSVFPGIALDSIGGGWLDPSGLVGNFSYQPSGNRCLVLSRIEHPELKIDCDRLGMVAFGPQTSKFVFPSNRGRPLQRKI